MLSIKNNLNFLLQLVILLLTVYAGISNSQSKLVENSHAKKETAVESLLLIDWDDLIPEYYRPETIIERYQPELEKLMDAENSGDEESSSALDALYTKIDTEMKNMPTNEALNNKRIKLAGFIAPLNIHNGLITEFLLVPYFGACIHVPPPPASQTVLIKVAPDNGIKPEDAYNSYWVSGQIRITNQTTDIGKTSYSIQNATIETYQK